MSIASWYVIVTNAWQLWRLRHAAHGRRTRILGYHQTYPKASPCSGSAKTHTPTLRERCTSDAPPHPPQGHLHDQLSVSGWSPYPCAKPI